MIPSTHLPDLCLVALFKQLPLADQMTARNLCRRWADLVPYAARSIRSLAIFGGRRNMDTFGNTINRLNSFGAIKVVSLLKKEDGSPMFPLARFHQWNTLRYDRGKLDEATVEAIAATFVNIDTLQIGFNYPDFNQYDSIAHLLKLWTHQLITLKVCQRASIGEKFSLKRFFAAINGLITLKHLRLDLMALFYPDLPIISQLEHLSVRWIASSKFAAQLRQYATANTSLRSVEYLGNLGDSSIEQFTSLEDHLLNCFTRLSRSYNSELINTHFRHLISLDISPTSTTTLRRLFGHLSQLTQLLHLQLSINFPSLPPDDQPQLLPQLKSVKALRLEPTIHSHHQLEQLKISWTMPKVEAIEFDFYSSYLCSKCTDCTIEEFNGSYLKANPATFKHCYRQMFVPLKANCTNLRAILHRYEDILGSAEELLAE